MKKIPMTLLILVVALLIGGGIFLATVGFPVPSKQVEKVIPDERLPH